MVGGDLFLHVPPKGSGWCLRLSVQWVLDRLSSDNGILKSNDSSQIGSSATALKLE
ncbi:hypothetical protein TIFTF001_037320 [Ficus carica]|uniref:Uncharacterized protein n=1 Tax=Ficus carica TaxID=3494 RepID=A0AA88E5V6_FICCA|nr:hypothetical protein TIFTF001_037320 [Ficus carica]